MAALLLLKAKMGYISIQNAKMLENIHLRWFIIPIRIGKRKKKTLFFNQSINQSIFMLELKTVFAWLSQNLFNNL